MGKTMMEKEKAESDKKLCGGKKLTGEKKIT